MKADKRFLLDGTVMTVEEVVSNLANGNINVGATLIVVEMNERKEDDD